MLVGFDISTKCIGWCVLEDDGSYRDVGYVWLEKLPDYYKKLDLFEKTLQKLLELSGGWHIFVEAPLPRSNNQNVVNILQRFNGMCCAYIYMAFGKQPELIAERDVRKLNEIKVPKGVKGLEKKKYVLQCVQEFDMIPLSKWEYKRTGNPKDFCLDMSDALCVAKAGYEMLNG